MKRDFVGYGRHYPRPKWPNQARVVINFVINYEEGAERSPFAGDDAAETYGVPFPFLPKPLGVRHLSVESLFEFGARVGIWRMLKLFDDHQIPLTIFATGYALSLNDEVCDYIKSSTHEVAGHGWRWIDYGLMDMEQERQHISQTIETIYQKTGHLIKGWYTGRKSPNTRQLLLEKKHIIYDSDSLADDLPFYENNHLIIPYNLDCNDINYTTANGFQTPQAFFTYLKNAFDFLYQEQKGAILTIGLHPRISGHAAKAQAIKMFIEYIKNKPKIWITKRVDIASFWKERYQAHGS